MYENLYEKELEESVDRFEKEHGDIALFYSQLTQQENLHNMITEESFLNSLSNLQKVYEEIKDLTIADLIDFEVAENFDGRDKKR